MAIKGFAHIDSSTGKVLTAEIPSLSTLGAIQSTKVASIDLALGTAQALLTVASNQQPIGFQFKLSSTTGTLLTVPVITIGRGSGANDTLAATTLTGLFAGSSYPVMLSAIFTPWANSDIINLKATTPAAFVTTGTFVVDVYVLTLPG